MGEGVFTGQDLLGETILALVVFPGDFLHPIVVEADDVWVGTVVDGELDLFALARGEQARKLQDVADVRAAPLVDRLVRVAHDADVAVLAGDAPRDRTRGPGVAGG